VGQNWPALLGQNSIAEPRYLNATFRPPASPPTGQPVGADSSPHLKANPMPATTAPKAAPKRTAKHISVMRRAWWRG
jgi:hypothetical protein